MTKLFIAAAAVLTLATPAFANEKAPRTFTRDGVTYVYTVTPKGDARVLEGSSAPGGESFRLVVNKGWVSGFAGGNRVSFRAPKGDAFEVAQR